MNSRIFARNSELKTLNNILQSKAAEFVAIYGRRRVGKTYLIREYFGAKGIYCEVIGKKDGSLHEQLEIFAEAFSKTFYKGIPIKNPTSWKEALDLLTKEIEKIPRTKKIIIFLDELPWMATPKSGLLQNLDTFWNSRWSKLPNVKIILCGSAASWMLENLINAKGGLYNRITKTILLEPFNLYETKMFLKKYGVALNNNQVLDIYMAMGGVAHYLKQVQKGKSAIQNINDICFHKDGTLYSEFPRLFKSLFDESKIHLAIIKKIAQHQYGISRTQLLDGLGVTSGGTFNKRLLELEAAGFIQSFVPYGKKIKDHYYRVIDEYSLFYLTWIEPYLLNKVSGAKSTYWPSKVKTGAWLNWAGAAFEQVCYKHTQQIKVALGLDQISCEVGSWRYVPPKGSKESGTQIDLLFDRDDNTMSICEIKYCAKEFAIDKTYAKNLINKMNVFEKNFTTKKQVFLTMITTAGIKKNMWSEDLVHNEVVLQDLMQE